MTTVGDFGEYTGVSGIITLDGVALADVQYDVKWKRATVSHSRGGKHSDINIPGKLTVTTKIKKALVYADAAKVLGYSLTDTPIAGTAETLLSASHVLDGTDNYEDMTDDTIASLSRVRYTLATKAITTGGTITVIGEDADGNAISEIITVPAPASIGATWTTTRLFKKVYGHTIRGIDSADDLGTFTVASIAGSATYTVGDPKIFDLVGSIPKGETNIMITQPDCWFSEGGIAWEDAGKVIDVECPVEMRDPDTLNVTVS
ncbi:MAG: hypothetical protein LUQ50_06375 [Methanospirillum sp.]|uniref:hypothetical protein n=1 Tax=Methanospirillum sp. TaxID=45200 RepID=UPI002370A55A|nr:hypothetical protein [Methanospirillum sp.]MDD1728679.1 hypothetical protein [Methanospirillum sp.]